MCVCVCVCIMSDTSWQMIAVFSTFVCRWIIVTKAYTTYAILDQCSFKPVDKHNKITGDDTKCRGGSEYTWIYINICI